jgi:hypothetical protein
MKIVGSMLGQILTSCATWEYYLDFEPTHLYAYSLVLSSERRNSKCQLYCLWIGFDQAYKAEILKMHSLTTVEFVYNEV